jgi:hypothetical protein
LERLSLEKLPTKHGILIHPSLSYLDSFNHILLFLLAELKLTL